MSKSVSIVAFSPYMMADGVRSMIVEGERGIRPVMSKGQVIAPIRFFERALGASVREDGAALILASAGRVLRITEGDKAYLADGVRGEFSVAPRREKGVLCLPAAETVCALGYEARQFGLMAVMDSEEELERLRLNPEEQATLEQATLGKYNAAYFTEADWKAARDSWRRELCGDEKTNDPSIPGMKNLLEMYDRNSERLRAKMNRDKDAVILFGTKPAKESYDMTLQYHDVLKMAQPYGTIGCRGYKSKELLDDILYAMDWMYDHMYGSNVLSDESFLSYRAFNWWDWYIGTACPMLDTVMIIEEDVGRDLVEKYILPASFIRTQMRVNPGEAEGMTRIFMLTPLALLTNDAALLQAEYLDETALLNEHDSGDCMRRDWCCMTHGMPYNICYGMCNLDRVARILKVMERTPMAYPIRKKYNLMKMARYTFAPVLYQGRILNLMNGRYIQDRVGASQAATILAGFRNLFGLFGEEEDRELSEIIFRNATPAVKENLISYYDTDRSLDEYVGPNTHLATYGLFRAALNEEQFETEPYTLGYMWYSGDCCVQFRNNRMIGLRMCSERSPSYECINSANGDGWYTGEGALYLYTPGADQEYDVKWWECVDKHLIPGTTVDARVRESMFFDRSWHNHQSYSGGVDLEGQFVTASMDLESFHCEVDEKRPDRGHGRSWPIHKSTLIGRKGYFLLDKAVVCIGNGINAQDNYAVRTVVENRMVSEGVLVNGEPLEMKVGDITRSDVKRIYVPNAGGYYFPQGGTVTIRVGEKDGVKFVAFWLEHGVNPENGEYAYVILPDATAGEAAAYDVSDVEILRNDGFVQAVREKSSGLTGVAFRAAGTFAGITADQPMIVMMHKTGDTISLTASEPTQKREAFSFTAEGAVQAEFSDLCIKAEQAGGGVKLNVACDSSRGRGYRAVLKMK